MNLQTLIGKTFVEVVNLHDEEIWFTTSEGKKYRMYHDQDCCEGVHIDDICGELSDLIGAPLLQAFESSSSDQFAPFPQRHLKLPDYGSESFTWTFYRFATIKGSVVIRWYGASNGYYSEAVSFGEVSDQPDPELA